MKTRKRVNGVTYVSCTKPDCDRWVREGSLYCCTPCHFADGNGPTGEVHEIHEHSAGCGERHAERTSV